MANLAKSQDNKFLVCNAVVGDLTLTNMPIQ